MNRFDNINETFDNYEKNTIQPVQVREARLHFIECQLKEHESSRQVEFDYFKELIKRLLIALEQSVFISGVDCVALSKRVSKTKLNRVATKQHSPIEEGIRGYNNSKQSMANFGYDGNRSMIEPSTESFLPSLTRNPHNQSNIIQNREDSTFILNQQNSRETSPLSSSSSKERFKTRYKGLKLSGDKILLKRILFLKETLDRNPHMNETDEIANQFKSSQKIYPPEPASVVEPSAPKLFKVEEPQGSSFFKAASVNYLSKEKSHSVVRKGYDSDKAVIKKHRQHTKSNIVTSNVSSNTSKPDA